jgi:hypothetical protein
MLFDDFAVHADPVPDPLMVEFARDPLTGVMHLTWVTEALYKYQVQYTDDLGLPWKSDLSGSFTTPAVTGISAAFTDASATGKARRFYRVVRSMP